ncbi:MAG TPA: endo-1,4-beta-xylanase [Lacipirellulaceae bacterium]
MRMHLEHHVCLILFTLNSCCVGAARADEPEVPGLTIAWENGFLTISGDLDGREIRVLYLEAYCRPGSTDRNWNETVIGHKTEIVDASSDRRRLKLRDRLSDGVIVDHEIMAGRDEVDFRLRASNPTNKPSQAYWAQPCIRVDRFTGLPDDERKTVPDFARKCFIFLDGQLSLLPTTPWAVEARYTPGQVYCPAHVDRNDVNPRPLSTLIPSSGLIGCFSENGDKIVAVAWQPYQELFLGVAACIHSDFRLGGLNAGEQKEIRGKIYIVNADVAALVKRYEQDFPEHLWGEDPQEKQDSKPDVSRSPQHDLRSLKGAAGARFKLGVGVSHVVLQNPEDAALIRHHFQILTPENCMKPQTIHPAEDEWNFEAADRFVEFARANNLEVAGHCLVWAKDDRTDQWMMEENGNPVSRETLLRRIETHVHTIVERYGDAVTMWDVVNEALADGDGGLLRDSVYSRTTGIDFIVTAFQAARAKAPDALLIYNDYNDHMPGKRKKVVELLSQLKQKGAPVDAYGMQGHFELGDDSIPQLRETFDALRKLKIKVVVSELDIDVVKRSRWWADGGKYRDELATHDPYKNGLPKEIEQKQLEQYVELFKLFDENSDIIERVSFWNLHDGQSWLNYFPWRRVNYPLLFDRNRRPKPVFDAVYALLRTSQ